MGSPPKAGAMDSTDSESASKPGSATELDLSESGSDISGSDSDCDLADISGHSDDEL